MIGRREVYSIVSLVLVGCASVASAAAAKGAGIDADGRPWRPLQAASAAIEGVGGRFLAVLASGRERANLRLVTKTRPDRQYATAQWDLVGLSGEARPIALRQFGDRSIAGKLLVFGCIHGDECAAGRFRPLSTLTGFCPDPSSDIFVVPNLNPDGAARGSRTNGRGVDLNRNFPSGWRPIGSRGDPQYSGPKPFSEPETRLAARIIRALQPRATIWFHQYRGRRPFVRAWGQSVPAARRFARLARMPFHLLPWPAGTAPNWQNHRFPGTSSFVVELPPGELEPAMEPRLAKAVVRLARQVRED
jgi:murein peptide amidase A